MVTSTSGVAAMVLAALGWCGWSRACRRSGAPPGCAAGTPTGPGPPCAASTSPTSWHLPKESAREQLRPASIQWRDSGRREWAGLAVLALACLLYAMDLTVLHLAVPAISEDLRPSGTQLLWITDIYGFMVAGFLITMGTMFRSANRTAATCASARCRIDRRR